MTKPQRKRENPINTHSEFVTMKQFAAKHNMKGVSIHSRISLNINNRMKPRKLGKVGTEFLYCEIELLTFLAKKTKEEMNASKQFYSPNHSELQRKGGSRFDLGMYLQFLNILNTRNHHAVS